MIKSERLRRGLAVAGTVAAALGGGIGAAQAAAPAHDAGVTQVASEVAERTVDGELPELPTAVEPSGLRSGVDSTRLANALLIPPFTDIFTALPIPNPADGLGALAGGGGKK
ncbi:hypothetical protein QA789_11095 [Streptomyces sp. B21-088]|uniref:hypothetical protein n=1 Tax=Streptomyces sp. B21-088 TaxID=3039411 RepID=UPI002FF07403